MTYDQKLVTASLAKATRKLAAAKNSLGSEDYEEAVSRAYYAVFHATRALLFSEGIETKTHAGLKSLFGLHFIETGKIDPQYAKYLRNLKDDREESDYEVYSSIDSDDASTALEEAEAFLDMAKAYFQAR